MITKVLKYRSDNLIIFYHCAYFGLPDTMGLSFRTHEINEEYRVCFSNWQVIGIKCNLHWKKMGRVWISDDMW